MEKSQKYYDFHQHYLVLKEMFESNLFEMDEMVFEIDDFDERNFHNAVLNYFLQKRQREVLLKNGVII
jgi:sulfur relay (sulfurtransferase) DsrF/TusC family protein